MISAIISVPPEEAPLLNISAPPTPKSSIEKQSSKNGWSVRGVGTPPLGVGMPVIIPIMSIYSNTQISPVYSREQ